MPGVLTETVTAYFDLTAQGGAFFTLDDPVKGVLDNATYILGGNVATDISDRIRSVQIRRGRTNTLVDIPAGVAEATADNRDRALDPEFAAGPYFGNIRPGKRVTFATNGIPTFDGLIDDWDFEYDVSGDSTANFDVVDALAVLASKQFDEWTSTAGQSVGQRITTILDRPEVLYPATRSIENGTSTLQADLVSWGSNVLNYAQLISRSDFGRLFAAKDGTLTFYGRDHPLTAVGCPQFRDDGTGIVYSAIIVDYGTEQLFNRVSVDAIGFTKQTVTDSVSIGLYGVRSLSLTGLPLQTQQQAVDLANILLFQYSQPISRVSSLTVDLHGLETADQNLVLGIDIGTVVRVVYTPNDISPTLDQFCLVEGRNDLIGPAFHQVTLNLSRLANGFAGAPFILDDAFYGVLDTAGHGVLYF